LTIMKSIASLAVLALAIASTGAWAETNGTSKGNAAKPTPTVGGAVVSKSAPPAIGGPARNTAPGGHVAAPVASPTIGGPSPSAPKASTVVAPTKPAPGIAAAPSKPAASMTAPASKPASPAPNTAKPVHQNL
jgi:hypothetical protein